MSEDAQSQATVLIVDDHKEDLVALESVLSPLGERVLVAQSADEGLRLAAKNNIAVAVVDIRMPGTDGFAMVEALRRDPEKGHLPVIFVSAYEMTPEMMKRVYALGAVDYVSLPVPAEVLQAKVSVFVELQRQTAKAREYAREIRHTAQSEMLAQQERFQLLADAISDYALFFIDAAGCVSEWTASAERLLGYTEKEAVGQKFAFIFTPEDRAKGMPARELATAVEAGQARDETTHLHQNGTLLPVTGRTVALKAPDGTLKGFVKILRDATQLRALRNSEARFREIFETANEGIWILNADTVIEVANRRIAEILGYGQPEIVGRKLGDFVFPEDAGYVTRLFEERRAGKTQPAVEVRFRHQTGAVIWTLLSARPIYRDGKFAGAFDMFTDITARRLAEDRFRVFFETSAAGHTLIDPASRRFIAVNRRFCEIVGRNAEELRRLTFSDITHPDDRAADDQRFENLLRGRVSEVSTEKRYWRPDGTHVWVHLTTSMVRKPDGTPEIQVSVVHDVTARKQAEMELTESRTRLRLAVEAADLGVFHHDRTKGRLIWNDRLKQLLGLPPEARESLEHWLRVVHPDDRARMEAASKRLLDAQEDSTEFELEYRVQPEGNVRWLKSNGVVEIRRENAELSFHVVGTVRDITKEKEFEAELRKQIAGQTRVLEEKTRQLESFCYTVAHDLRAPLRAINGYADLVLEDLAGGQRAQSVEYLERIRSSTQRLDALINDLLSYSRVELVSVRKEAIDLNRIIGTVLHELEDEIAQRKAVVVVRDTLPEAFGERTILEQVFLNLISNALKFSQPGKPPQIEIFADDGDGRVRVYVRDHGIGIPPEYHERIFKVFERLQTSRTYPGTGIGLAIVAKGVERLGGRCGVESEPGRGSQFWIELKKAESHDETTA